MKFRKKPVVIEATQFNKLGDHPAVVEWPESPTGFGIHTLEHVGIKHEVTPGDWIITGVENEVYACKPDIFAKTYEPIGAKSLPEDHPSPFASVCVDTPNQYQGGVTIRTTYPTEFTNETVIPR